MINTWRQVEISLWDLFKAGTGFADARIISARRPGPRPTAPLLDYAVMTHRAIGSDQTYKKTNPNSNGSDGVELISHTFGHRELTISVRCFGDMDAGEVIPDFVLSKVIATSQTPTWRMLMRKAGIGIVAWDAITTVDQIVGEALWEPRAQTTLRLRMMIEVTEFVTWVERVRVRGFLHRNPGPDFDINVE